MSISIKVCSEVNTGTDMPVEIYLADVNIPPCHRNIFTPFEMHNWLDEIADCKIAEAWRDQLQPLLGILRENAVAVIESEDGARMPELYRALNKLYAACKLDPKARVYCSR